MNTPNSPPSPDGNHVSSQSHQALKRFNYPNKLCSSSPRSFVKAAVTGLFISRSGKRAGARLALAFFMAVSSISLTMLRHSQDVELAIAYRSNEVTINLSVKSK